MGLHTPQHLSASTTLTFLCITAIKDVEDIRAVIFALLGLVNKKTYMMVESVSMCTALRAPFQVWDAVSKDFIYLPSSGRYGRAASATASERLDSVKSDFNIALAEMKKQAERAKKVENKVWSRGRGS